MTQRTPGKRGGQPARGAKRPAGARRTSAQPSSSATSASSRTKKPSAAARSRMRRTGSRPGSSFGAGSGSGIGRRLGRRGPRRRRGLKLATGPFRLWSAFCVVAFVLSLFAGRLIQLQGIDENGYAAMATQLDSKTITLEAPRAPIYDRNGTKLASTVNAAKLVADPTYTHKHATQIATILHRQLGLDYLTTLNLLEQPNTRYVELARHLRPQQAAAIVGELNRHNLPGVYSDGDTLRTYPAGDVGANLVGFVGANNHGLSGFEHSYDSRLAGHNGSATFQVADGQQLPLASSTVVAPKEGTGVRLTIDEDLQFLAQHRLAEAVRQSGGQSGAAVIMDVKTGQVLALADYPTFNPNNIQNSNPANFGSRALQDAYEPGSVEKVLTFSALINDHIVTPRTKIVVPPQLQVGPDTIHDYFSHGYLHLTATGVVALSSNIGTVRATQKISSARLYHYLRLFGLGQQTGVGYAGESPGILPKPSTWLPIKHDNIAFGQGLSVNALQMTAAISAVANGGVYVHPSLIEGYVAHDGAFTPAAPPRTHRVIRASTARAVAHMMEAVVGPNGTAPLANINGYNVAGKTGTAQRVGPSCGCYNGTYTVSFAGFAPADKPRFAVYVVIQAPTDPNAGGGVTAGPVFHDLMAATLQKFGVPPTGKRERQLPIGW
ncbi:MAG: peptidoglycan D,D-transpeptidase FtsI family protein [Nocardioidaceae bacterium]